MAKARQKRKMLEKYLAEREKERKRHNTEQNLQSFAQYWRCQQTARNQVNSLQKLEHIVFTMFFDARCVAFPIL